MVKIARSRVRFGSMLAAGIFVLASCGGGGGSNAQPDSDLGQRPNLPVDPKSASGLLPNVTVLDLTNNKWVQFANFLPSDKPVLVWFWAPHCPICQGEAPGVEKFAQQNQDKLTVIGIGTQDTVGEAYDFVDRYKTTFTMLWDETFETWLAFGVSSQPAAMLLTADGQFINGWTGPFPENEVLRLIGA